MHRVLSVAHILGKVLMVFSLAYLLPILTSLIYRDGQLADFFRSLVLTLGFGTLLWLATRDFKREMKPRDGFLMVVSTWLGVAAFSTLPLLGSLGGLTFTHAFFECMSGLTTTGATVLSGLDNLPQSINLWRHELSWIGGMGIIVLAVAILPLLGVGGMQLSRAETPGPMKDSKLAPRITETAKNLWLVYFAITLACIIALKLAGMSGFDAICHAFSAMSLGGFSTHDASIAYFHSPAIEIILTFFMLVAGMNFATHFLALRGKSLKLYRADREGVAFIKLVSGSVVAIALFLWHRGIYDNFWTALRHASFNVVSIATDCGLTSTDYNAWPILAPLWMLFLSCISVSSGSTGGGIKMIRTLVLVKQSQREMLRLLHPSIVNPLKINGQVVQNNVVYSVLGFIFLYFMSILVLVFMLVGSGFDFVSSFSAIIACINNVGPGLGQVGPATTYGSLNSFQAWVCILAMLLGRLEIFSILILLTPAFWRK